MSISFKDSLKKESENNAVATMAVAAMNIDDFGIAGDSIMTLDEIPMIAAYSGNGGSWQQHPNYVYYSSFSDDNISSINDRKDISLNEKQINITQEENSQFIPFEMNRYYDNYDLINTVISIHYETKNGRHGSSKAVNVTFNDEKIRFGWLVDAGATIDAGKLKFEIHAYGTVTGNDGVTLGYVWKTKCNESINVLESLCDCEDVINNIDDSWMQELVTDIAERIAEEIKDVAVGEQVKVAEEAATRAEAAANRAEETVTNALDGYAKESYVDEKVASVDVSKQLEDYALETYVNEQIASVTENVYSKTDSDAKLTATLESYATKDDVSTAIAEADITGKLENYYKKEETYSRDEVDTALENVSVDLTGYATTTYVDTKTSGIVTNAESISTLGKTVESLQKTVNSVDTSPRLTYDVVYNDTEDPDVGENVFVFYEIENEGKEGEKKEAKKKFTITGGSGGGATSSSLKIGYITTSPLVVTTTDNAIIKYTFSGTDSSGDAVPEGTATWKVGGRIVATNTALNGENSFDITEYLTVGTQKVNLSIVDEAGSLVTKTWTVQKIDVRIESTFNDKFTYPMDAVSFDYTPFGAISKDIHFILDGKEIGKVTTASSGVPMAYEIPKQAHGSHLLEVYMTSETNGNSIESNHIVKDILWYDGVTSPVIGTVYQEFTARQYDATNIEYTVYDPSTETPTIEIAVDGEVVSTLTLNESTNIYTYKTDDVGEHIITITCGDTVKTLKANITKLDIDISPVTAGLAFDFNPSGKSNNDIDRIWTDGTTSMSVSDNFDWINGGYQYDENGDQYFCIKAGTFATIDYKLFADDAKKNGKEMKLVFKTTNVSKPDATFLNCIDNTTDTDHIGIRMDVHEAFIYGQASKLHLLYSEEDIIEFEFNISKNTEAIPMVMGYEDGVSTCPMVYGDSHNFTQNTPQIISLGSNDCDLYIYRFKVYNTSLTDRGILNNFIADARNAEEMIARYDRNQIYDENQNLDPDVLAEKCPWLRVIKVEAPHFTAGKKYPVNNTTIEYIYKNGDHVLDNWKATDAVHVGQGTSSDDYGASGRNMDLVLKSHKDFNNSPVITLGDGTIVDKVSLTRSSVPVNYFNIKVNVASSDNANNPLLQRRYNEYNPYNRAFVREDGYDTSMIKDTMEFYNCVVFIKESDKDLSTHTEFADNDWHFYAIGNIGDSKKTDKTRLTDPDDRYECINEIVDVELPLSDFPTGDEAISIVEAEKFDKSGTYEWRYIWEDGTDEENAEVAEYCKQKWIDFYKFVVTSTDEEFKTHLGDYFVLDSALYYYLFTTRYTMVDNRCKNSFWHYGWTGEYDTEGNKIRKWDLAFDYDNDTALGINNYGDMVYRYGLEDIHVDENGTEVFRESDSTFFCRLRDLFADELKALYNTLESQNAWHGEGLINQFDEWQSEFPEELWRLDIERKYIRTYNSSHVNGKGDDQFLKNMAHGKKKYQRRQYERNQEKYMASKYQSSVASSDANSIIIRCTTPSGELAVQPNYSLTLTPYAYMYLNVQYSNGTIQVPVEEIGKPITVLFDGDSTDIIKIYSGHSLQSIGDLSPLYAKTINASSASKLKELIIGNEIEGYDNPYLETLTTGANYLLEKLNIENVSGLTDPLDLSALHNLREFYARGSNIGGVTFADGGRIEIAELPAVNGATMKNLAYLTTLDIADFSKLTSITVENCNTVDLITILNSAPNINRVRIIGVNWNLDSTAILERLYGMKGFDKDGYNSEQSVLSGIVSVPTIGQYELYKYQQAWSDLTIIPTTIIKQFVVTFINDDGTVLDTQYVDQFGDAVNPITREENPIDIPTKESSVQHDYSFDGWNNVLTNIVADRTITATYRESLRNYTIQYVSKGTPLKTETAPYGSNIVYNGEIPTYTLEEPYTFYLFNRWDKSGFLDNNFDENGVKTVTAVFDKFEYTEGVFDNRELDEFTPVEIYALTKLNAANKLGIEKDEIIVDKDSYSFVIGNDVEYDDIESELLISEKTHFNGSKYIDTGIQLFDEDRDFILAIDYEFLSGNKSNAVLAQCFQANGTNGFKLWYGNSGGFDGARLTWGTSSDNIIGVNKREIVVIRHKKGENNLMIYKSNLDGDSVIPVELERTKSTIGTGTLVFGSARADDGIYENYAIGNINWAKIWYKDLGDDVCQSLAMWTHESITLEACGFRKYYLSDDPFKRCTFSLLASHLLGRTKKWNTSNINTGGWAESALNKSLNTRLYNAMPTQIKSLIKKTIVYSSIGDNSNELSSSDCYITIPSIIEVDPSQSAEPYNSEGTAISYLSTNDSRKRAFDNGNYNSYWLRSPSTGWSNYVWRIEPDGSTQPITNASAEHGVLIEISF